MPVILLDYMEYSSDANAQAAYVTNAAYVSEYPPAYNSTYVKATREWYAASIATNPATSMTGSADNPQSCWSAYTATSNQRFHIDLGSAKVITRIYYENYHHYGTASEGMKDFTFWGSNSSTAFAELTYGTDTNWTQITTSSTTFEKHIAADQADPKYITATNTTAYRYYAIKISTGWTPNNIISARRIVLQSGPSLQAHSGSEHSQGLYSLKAVAAQTDSLNKTLTRTISPTINLSGKKYVKFQVRAVRTGSNFKIGFHDAGGTTTEVTPNIIEADKFQEVYLDVSGVSDVNKDAIDSIIITILNADAANIIYFDNMYGIIPRKRVILV